MPVQDTQHFLDLLKNLAKITRLDFHCVQPQELLDRLPEHCAVQHLTIYDGDPNFPFIFRLKNLLCLQIDQYSISVESVQKAFEELPFLSSFKFSYANKKVAIEINRQERLWISVDAKETLDDVNAAIQFVTNIPNQNEPEN